MSRERGEKNANFFQKKLTRRQKTLFATKNIYNFIGKRKIFLSKKGENFNIFKQFLV